ncbi:MAG: hypothetical protein WD184_09730 [Acidimicrobiia bacterium]
MRPGGAIIGLLFALVATACADESASSTTTSSVPITTGCDPTVGPVPAPEEPFRGFSLSPVDYEGNSLVEFLETAAANGEAIERVGDILEWEEPPSSGLAVVDGLAAKYGYFPLSITGVFNVDDGVLLRLIDDETFDRYVTAARSYAANCRPPYLGLGVEIDSQWRLRPQDFDRFAELFAAVAVAVDEVSPDTEMFTSFQLERISGMLGGLFGGVNDPELALWTLIDRFPDADIIAFTTYPGLVFSDPAEIPEDYYSRLNDYAGGRRIAFTEMGWQSAGEYGAYSGSEEKQLAFVTRFHELIEDADVAFYIWSFLYDQQVQGPFASMGLVDRALRPKAAWWEWQSQGG